MKINYIALTICLIFMSCNSQNPSEKLEGKDWEVIQIEDVSEFSKAPIITFNVKENKVSGNTGCNNFFGELNLEDNKLTLGKMGATKMLCSDMTAEDLFFKITDRIAMFKFEDDRLVLLSEDNELLMILQ